MTYLVDWFYTSHIQQCSVHFLLTSLTSFWITRRVSHLPSTTIILVIIFCSITGGSFLFALSLLKSWFCLLEKQNRRPKRPKRSRRRPSWSDYAPWATMRPSWPPGSGRSFWRKGIWPNSKLSLLQWPPCLHVSVPDLASPEPQSLHCCAEALRCCSNLHNLERHNTMILLCEQLLKCVLQRAHVLNLILLVSSMHEPCRCCS